MANVFDVDTSPVHASPFQHFSRGQWDALANRTPLPLTEKDITDLASLGDPIDLDEVNAIYRPLSALLQIYVDAMRRTGAQRRSLLQEPYRPPTPFIIGIAGSVAVGKSTVSRLLQLLLSRWERTPKVDLVTTDGFLYPNKVLEEQGLIFRKGFPESYDREALIDFVARVKAGEDHVEAPVYSHVEYDVVEGETIKISHPDILILEGLNVLQPARTGRGAAGMAVSDYFDFGLYVDAKARNIERWYVDRFLKLRGTAFTDPKSYFSTYANLTDEEARETAKTIWHNINLPNLQENIKGTRPRATLVLRKGADHRVRDIFLRKI